MQRKLPLAKVVVLCRTVECLSSSTPPERLQMRAKEPTLPSLTSVPLLPVAFFCQGSVIGQVKRIHDKPR
jgi:hypothetical protein